MDEEARRRRPMRNDPLSANPESAVRELIVRRHPAQAITPPPDLRERPVESVRKRRQHDLGVEVSDPQSRRM